MLLKHALRQLPLAVVATAALSSIALVAPAGSASAATTPVAASTLTAASTAVASRAGVTPQSASGQTAAAQLSAQAALLARSAAIVSTAASLKGRPYVYGASGPSAFDCSGFTTYVMRQMGIKIPRTAQQQYRAATHISKSAIRPGDLVFFLSGNYAYHVAVYAGDGYIWHAPHSGQTVRLTKIWTSNWVAGRVL